MLNLDEYLELRRARWLEKLSHMDHSRIPRLLLGSWIPQSRNKGKAGRAQHTIRHAYACTLAKLGYTDINCSFRSWMSDARDRKKWSKIVELSLGLNEGAYCRKNAVHQAAELREFK